MIKRVMRNLKRRGKGIILLHDIQPKTAKAMPDLLKRLKNEGYKVVHLTAKERVQTLPEYDEKILKSQKGRGQMARRPMSSVITTVEQ